MREQAREALVTQWVRDRETLRVSTEEHGGPQRWRAWRYVAFHDCPEAMGGTAELWASNLFERPVYWFFVPDDPFPFALQAIHYCPGCGVHLDAALYEAEPDGTPRTVADSSVSS